MITVAIADDRPLMRQSIHRTLGIEPDIVVVSEAETSDSVEVLCGTHPPDVLVLALQLIEDMPEAKLSLLQQLCPSMKILLVICPSSRHIVRATVVTHASGFFQSSEPPDVLVRAIRAVARGEVWISSTLVKSLAPVSPEAVDLIARPQLTQREIQILSLVSEGKPDRTIAEAMGIGERTVRQYLTNICNKLDVANRTAAVVRAIRLGLI